MTARRIVTNDRFQAALARLEQSKLTPRQKKVLARIGAVHANPDAQKPDVVIRSMRKRRKEQATAAANVIVSVLGQAAARGKGALERMNESEWEMLNGDILGDS